MSISNFFIDINSQGREGVAKKIPSSGNSALSCELSQHLQFMYRIPKMANSIEDITGSGANITIKSWKYTMGPISLLSQSRIWISIFIEFSPTLLITLNSEDEKLRIYILSRKWCIHHYQGLKIHKGVNVLLKSNK